jgi:leucyl aminopeptidase
MSSVTPTAQIAIATGPLSAVHADLLVVPWFEDDSLTAPGGTDGPGGTDEAGAMRAVLDRATGGELHRALTSKEFEGKAFDLFVTPAVDSGWRAKRIAFIGAGRRSDASAELLRKLASTAGYDARRRHLTRVAFVVRGTGDRATLAQASVEGLTLAEFHGGSYKTADAAPPAPPAWTIVMEDAAGAVNGAVHRGRVLGECSNLARQLANEPGNTLTPREFANRAARIAAEGGVKVEILDEQRIAALNMGLLLGVARGSSEPPRLMVFRHDPPGAPATPVLGLVGKGVTFDTGGISIKPADGMERMKDDMAGGAAVACAMRAIGLLGAPIRVVGVVPTTENMPGGRAIKPGDILKSAEGKTVEVINTDAEGRLILGDGLWYARQLGATHLVDVATLTGAVVVALGKTTAGLFGTPDAWVRQVHRVADRAGDRSWPLPIFDDYRDQLKSEIADLANTGGRPAGSITAALFLKEFTGGLPWVHLDIAGTAWAEESRPFMPKGATGAAVRTLASLAFEKLEG